MNVDVVNNSGRVTKFSSIMYCQLIYRIFLWKGSVSRGAGGRQACKA